MALNRWQALGYLTAFLSPILGIVVGMMLYTDKTNKDHKSTGKYVVILSVLMIIAWGLLLFKRGF